MEDEKDNISGWHLKDSVKRDYEQLIPNDKGLRKEDGEFIPKVRVLVVGVDRGQRVEFYCWRRTTSGVLVLVLFTFQDLPPLLLVTTTGATSKSDFVRCNVQ